MSFISPRPSFSQKILITVYLLLSFLGFCVAGLMSRDRYGFDHHRTQVYYLGNETEMAFPKEFSQLIQGAHVHSLMMPVVFLLLWYFLEATAISSRQKIFWILGGAISILVYIAAPFVLRYVSSESVWLFTIGGVGLFVFYFIPALKILWEVWKKPSVL